MAKYWENLKYHEDAIEKHKITIDEIDFLKKLQKEMNTQDHVGEADPRYWVIRDYECIYGTELSNPDGCVIIFDCEEILRVEYTIFGDNSLINEAKSYFMGNYDCDFSLDDFEDLYDIDDLKEMLEERGYEITVREYEIIPKHSGMFLTQKAAEDHLRLNYYHYDDNATTYAMTAWRSPEAEMLYKILHSVDFDQLN